jgi:hypothetical protein
MRQKKKKKEEEEERKAHHFSLQKLLRFVNWEEVG